jgi:hypothetical protein
MVAVGLWLLAVAACVMLATRSTRNAGLFAVSGATMALLFHYDIATIPEVRDLAYLLWAVAAALSVAKVRANRQGRTV